MSCCRLGWTKGLRHYWLIALLRVTLASKRKICISDFQGQAVLSLQDSLRSSTQVGRIEPLWPLHLGETWLPWKSKDKKCLRCSTHLSIRWCHRKILCPTRDFLQMHLQETVFFWFTSDTFLKRPVLSYQNSYVKFLWGGLQAKVVLERTTYCACGDLQRVPSSVSVSRLRPDTLSWAKPLRNPTDQDDCKKGTLKDQPRLTRITPTVLLGSRVLQPIKDMMSLGTDFETHAKWPGSIEELAAKDFCCKEGPHYQIKQSARNPLECKQVQRALGESSRSCCQTSNNQPWFTSLEIPWGFLAKAVLHWLSRGLCHARECQFKDITWEEKVWFAIAQGRLHEKPLAKGGTGKENRY